MITGYTNIKRWYAALAVAAAGLFMPSCVSDYFEDGEGKGEYTILFSPAIAGGGNAGGGTVTKAGDNVTDPGIYSPDDLLDQNIYIFGNRYPKAGSSDWSAGSIFFNSVTGRLAKQGTEYYLRYNPVKYWDPADRYKHDFRVVYPTSTEQGVTLMATDASNPNPRLYIELYKRPDLILASVDQATKTDGYTAATHTAKPLSLNFEHQLAFITLQIYKDPSLDQNVYLDRIKVTGPTRGVFDVVDQKWSDIEAVTGASILMPGWPQPPDFLIPDDENDPKKIKDITLLNVPMSSNLKPGETLPMTHYVFTMWLNETQYQFTLPPAGKTWQKGYKYVYTLKVLGTDIHIEIDDTKQKEICEDVARGTPDQW